MLFVCFVRSCSLLLLFCGVGGPMLSSHFSNPRFAHGFSFPDFLELAVKLVQIVADVHAQDIIHRDISAANILFQPHTKSLRLIDFGLATAMPSKQAVQAAMQPAMGDAVAPSKPHRAMQGTLLYMAPECTGAWNRLIDQRSDIYAVGVVLSQMLTGQLPLQRARVPSANGQGDELESIESFVQTILTRVPVPAHVTRPWIPRIVSQILSKAMAKNPDDRYASAFGGVLPAHRGQGRESAVRPLFRPVAHFLACV